MAAVLICETTIATHYIVVTFQGKKTPILYDIAAYVQEPCTLFTRCSYAAYVLLMLSHK